MIATTHYVVRLHGATATETWAETNLPAAIATAYTVVRAAEANGPAPIVSIARTQYDTCWNLVADENVLAATGLADLRDAVVAATGSVRGVR